MFKRFVIISIIAVVTAGKAVAQYDASFSHYWAMESFFNPAAVGKVDQLNVVGAYGLSFAGYENNPRSFYVGADMPIYALRQYHGVGASMLNDQIGLFSHQRLAGQYAFRKTLLGGTLSAGVQLGLIMEKFDGSKIDLDETTDPTFPSTEVSGQSLDIGVGAYFRRKNWYVGASVQHLNAPIVLLGEKNELEIKPTYYLTGGYNIRLRNPFLSIPTSVLARYDGNGYRADITARLVYQNEKRRLYGGVSYSPTNSVTAYIGGSFQGINIGYSYEVYTGTADIGNGSHELFIGYQTDINLQKKGRNKHKSVRFL
ncbi:MAG: type IX secretion system membrane protein PorP/SprF [Prevotella sp.]|nr:type IX secretion system membrane protein PorP/SprF [Prevotella sp.]MDY4218540.1 type IX secretion system membrane protein PorP/SprF [Prevotella sp.]